jgi:hypothetical protein
MEIRDYLESLSGDQVSQHNAAQLEEALKEHETFIDAFNKDCCYMCGMKLSYFHASEPCMHWLLLPEGIKKTHVENYLTEPIGIFRIESYLRWLANTEAAFKNINDLPNDNPKGKLLETTIKFKNIEWSLNFGQSDLVGHPNSKNAAFPHFHMQILSDGMPFIRFNDCHIPFSNRDLFILEALKNDDLFGHSFLGGEGISAILDGDQLKIIDENMIPIENTEDATFHTKSIIRFPPDLRVTEEDVFRLKEESMANKIPLRKYIKQVYPSSEITAITGPGEGVIKKKGRSKR